jgi:hypothetical protein
MGICYPPNDQSIGFHDSRSLGIRKGDQRQRGGGERWQGKGCLNLEGAQW